MGIIIESWNRHLCPVSDGIYLPDDTFWGLTSFAIAGHLSGISGHEEMGDLDVEGPLAENETYLVFGGETSWEGCGFLALTRKPAADLLWLIHSSESEPFREAQLTADSVVAVSSEYPSAFQWTIPFASPNRLAVIRKTA